jgi:superfamily II DNA or RNA helicase
MELIMPPQIIKLRDYQKEAIAALQNGRLNKKKRQLVTLPTGSGKTIVAAQDIKNAVTKTGQSALFIAHRDELIKQAKQKIQLVWPEADIGRIKAKDNELGHKVTVASVQTIQRDKRLTQLVEAQKYRLLYIDEAHHAAAKTYQKIITQLTKANPHLVIVGLTATPIRADAKKMSDVFTEITYQKSMIDLITEGYLADIQLKQVQLNVSIDNVSKQKGDLKPSEIKEILIRPDIMLSMVNAWKKEASPKRTLAFTIDVDHAHELCECFNDNNVSARLVHGKTPEDERAEILNDFQAGKFKVLVNCMIFTEGYDDISTGDDHLGCIMLTRPTLSQSLYIQQVGRGTRLAPGKDKVLVLDFAYNSNRHHLVQLPHLFGKDFMKGMTKYDRKGFNEKDIPSILAAVREAQEVDISAPPPRAGLRWAKLEDGFALSIGKNHGYVIIREEPSNQNEKKFNVFHYAPPFDSEEYHSTADYVEHRLTSESLSFEWAFGLAEDAIREMLEARTSGRKMKKTNNITNKNAEWLFREPTEAQLKVLRRHKQRPKTRGEAADMITALIATQMLRNRQPATKKQIGYLRWRRIGFNPEITKGQASKLISQYKKQ